MELTDRLSVGASTTLGTAFEQLGFVGPIVGSAMVNDYGCAPASAPTTRSNNCNTVGVLWQSKMDFQFPDAIRVGGELSRISTSISRRRSAWAWPTTR